MAGVPIATIILMNRHASDTNRLNDRLSGRLYREGAARSDAHRVREVGTDRCGTIVSLNGVHELLPLNLLVCRGWFDRMTQAL